MDLKRSRPYKVYDFIFDSMVNDRYQIVVSKDTGKKKLIVW